MLDLEKSYKVILFKDDKYAVSKPSKLYNILNVW